MIYISILKSYLCLEAKSSDPRATVGYLLGDMTRVYDALPLVDKVVIEVATNSGYYGNKVFIVDQYNQYDLHAKLWLPLDQTGQYSYLV